MDTVVATQVQDFYPLLREAITEARSAGFAPLADSLESCAFASYTTSSELLGETGRAIVEFLHAASGKVPPSVAVKLQERLHQVQQVWPEIRV
jgi:hypothetical protein